MLRACGRILKPGGRMAFLVIEPAADLTARDRRRAARRGPPSVLVRTSYPRLLASAGFRDIELTDVTADYRSTQQAWIDAGDRHWEAMAAAVGDELEVRQGERRATVEAIDQGLLVRRLYRAVR